MDSDDVHTDRVTVVGLRSLRPASICATLLLVLLGALTLRAFLPALAWALIFATGLWPAFDRLAGRWPRWRRGVLPAAFTLSVLLLFVVPLVIVAVPLVSETREAMAWLARARVQGIAPPAALTALPGGVKLAAVWQHNIGQPGQVAASANRILHGSHLRAERAIVWTVHGLAQLFFMLLSFFFLLREGETITRQLRIASYRAFGPQGEKVGLQMISSVRGTIDGLVLVGVAEGVLLGTIYWLAGVPRPTLFGLITVLLAMVPFGATLAFLLAAAIVFLLGHPTSALIVVVSGALITFIADHFVRPTLIGGATKLPFLWVLLGILGGVEAWGLVGLFLGPALMASLLLLWREWVGEKRGPLDPPPGVADSAEKAAVNPAEERVVANQAVEAEPLR